MILTVFFLPFNQNYLPDKISKICWLFFVFGTFQMVVDLMLNRESLIKCEDFYKMVEISLKKNIILLKINESFRKIFIFIKIIFLKLRIIYKEKIISPLPKTFLGWIIYILKIGLLAIFLFFVAYGITSGSILITKKISAYDLKQKRLRLNPKIVKIEPLYVYPGQKVILTGTNFCNNDRVNCTVEFSHHKEKIIDLISGGKIIFTIPLDLQKNTDVYVKIKKKIAWLGKPEIAESNVVKFKLLDPLTPWNADTDAYFEQMKNLSEEAKRINGLN